MAKYRINVPETHWTAMLVEADSIQEAFEKVENGDGDMTETEYGDTLQPYEKPWNGYLDEPCSQVFSWDGETLKDSTVKVTSVERLRDALTPAEPSTTV